MTGRKGEAHTAVFYLHEYSLGPGIAAFPQVKITMTNASTLHSYKNLIVYRLWGADLFDFKRILRLHYSRSLHTN
jgi:hypothetical protein